MKEKLSFKKLAWVLLAIIAVLLLALSVGYYARYLHQGRMAEAMSEGRHVTLEIATGKLVEGQLYAEKEEPLPVEEGNTAGSPAAAAVQDTPKEKAPVVEAGKPEGAVQDKPASVPAPAIPVPAKNADTVPPAATDTATTAKPAENLPRIAILITGLGLSKSSTDRVLTLPREVTLGFSPYSLDIENWVAAAAKNGHEIFINVPMQAMDAPPDDPGSFALLTSLNADNNLKRLDWVLSRVQGYKGVYSDPDERFTESQGSIRPILKALNKRGLTFVYGVGYSNNSFLQMAKDMQQPMVVSDVVIDTKISASHIKENLAALEQAAKRNGYALGMGAPYPITIKIVERWLAGLEEKGIVLVPVSMLLDGTGTQENSQ